MGGGGLGKSRSEKAGGNSRLPFFRHFYLADSLLNMNFGNCQSSPWLFDPCAKDEFSNAN